ELQQHSQILVDVALRLELELRHLPALTGPVRDVEEMRHTFRRRAEALQPLLRPGIPGGTAEMREHRLVEEESDMQLFAALAEQEGFMWAGEGGVPLAEGAIDQEIAHGRRLDAMDGMQELLQLRD